MQLIGALVGRQHRIRAFHQVVWSGHEKTCGCIFPEDIAGKLLDDKAVVQLVLVQSADHVIAVGPGSRARRVHLETGGLGEPHHVQPMARPSFAVLGRGQQFFDEPLVGAGRPVPLECARLLRRGRQTNEIEIKAADECSAIRLRRKREFLLGEFGRYEGINRIDSIPSALCVLRHSRPNHRLE